jgi:hypothetical protein
MNETRPTLGQKISKLIKESQYKTPHGFYKAIQEMSGKDAISEKSLYNVLGDQRVNKETTLFQIAAVLGMEIFELRKGTTSEPPTKGPSKGVFQYNESSTLYNLFYGLPFKVQMIEIKGADTITKRHFSKIGSNGTSILNKLIKNDILENISSRAVRIKGNLDETKNKIREIAGNDFDKVLAILQGSLSGRTIEENEEIEGSKCFRVAILAKGDANLIIKHRDGKTECIELRVHAAYHFDSGEFHYFENRSKQFARIVLLSYLEPIKK